MNNNERPAGTAVQTPTEAEVTTSAQLAAIPLLAAVYVCNACGLTVERKSNKAWINSYCTKVNKKVRLQKTKI